MCSLSGACYTEPVQQLLGLDDLAMGTNIDLNETAASRGHSFKVHVYTILTTCILRCQLLY